MIQQQLLFMWMVGSCFYKCVNPFVPSASFLYSLETSEMLTSQPYGFLMFSGGRERVHWEQMGLR